MGKYSYAEILLPLALNTSFTYKIDSEQSEKIEIGSRLIVNFGKRKLYTGLVIELHNRHESSFEIKPIESIYDEEAIVNETQLKLWKWIAEYYCCTIGEVLNAAIPSVLIPHSETRLFLLDSDEVVEVNSTEQKILSFLLNSDNTSITDLIKNTGIKNPVRQIYELQKKGLIAYSEKVKTGYKPLYVNMIAFDVSKVEKNHDIYDSVISRASKQAEILKYIANIIADGEQTTFEIEEKIVIQACNCSRASLKSLEKKNLIKLFQKTVSRFSETNENIFKDFDLSPVQSKSLMQIEREFTSKKPVLLHGVTSGGKTEVYIRLIEKRLKQRKSVLYLLPEIALTSQIIERLRKYFGARIGIYHSKYSMQERAEVYKSVLRGELDIVLGARSAIFLPFSNLGLIIVDEEHDNSYKQTDPAPRYNARDTALVLAHIHKANIILGTATPSVESYYNTTIGKYSLVELNQRYGDIKLPEILVIDIKDAYRRKIMQAHFHPQLANLIRQTLDDKKQIILFQNRRGFSPYIQCAYCGNIPICNTCNVSLTYHKFRNSLLCHYCGKQINFPEQCPYCTSKKLLTRGLGTELIENEAAILFPEAVIQRLDYDTTRTRKSYENIISDFASGKIDILVGTQMVSKGLDFENVSLVGIMNADSMLGFPDFRAFERSFQLMSQVAGRSGRRKDRGRVVIQTFDPTHPVLKYVVENDYDSLYKSQMEERQAFLYPPISFFIIIRLKHKDIYVLNKAASLLANDLKRDFNQRVKGPEEPLINKIKNTYIKNIHLRFEKNLSAKKVKSVVMQKCSAVKSLSDFSSVSIQIDVDPG